MTEKQIEKMMKSLDVTREEAIELINEDAEVDKMKSAKELQSDLTDAQKKASKSARKTTGTKVYKFDTSKREKKAKPEKKAIIDCLRSAVEGLGGTVTEVVNEEREFTFSLDGVGYKITMAVPRTKKVDKGG